MAATYGYKRTVVGAHYGWRDFVVQRITAAAVPALADWCRFTVILDDGEVRVKTAVAHPEPEFVALTRWLETQQPFRPDAKFGAAKVIAEGRTAFHAEIDPAQIEAVFDDPAVARVIVQLGMRSVITVPVSNPSGTIGALQLVLALTGLTIDQMDVIELNEAFAAQGLAVLRALGVQDADPRVNPNGGAIALGHPLGASGARLATTAVNQLMKTGGRYALCTMCIGVGQGIAVVLERV